MTEIEREHVTDGWRERARARDRDRERAHVTEKERAHMRGRESIRDRERERAHVRGPGKRAYMIDRERVCMCEGGRAQARKESWECSSIHA